MKRYLAGVTIRATDDPLIHAVQRGREGRNRVEALCGARVAQVTGDFVEWASRACDLCSSIARYVIEGMPDELDGRRRGAPASMSSHEIDVKTLHPSKDNVRRDVGDVTELAASIASVGLIEPLVVRPNGDAGGKPDGFVVVAGARRLAAARIAGLKTVPCLVRELTEAERLEVMLVENLQREDLAPLEEAEAYQRLIDACGYTQEQVATRVGVTQPHVSKRLSLLNLPAKVRQKVDAGGIPVQAGVALARLAAVAPERVDQVLKRASMWGDVRPDVLERAVMDALEDARHLEQTKRKTAKLRAAGNHAVLEFAPDGTRPKGTLKVTTDRYEYQRHVHMTPSAHAKGPCHAVAIDPRDVSEVALCTDPKRHAKADTGFTQAVQTLNNRTAKIAEHRKALEESQQARRDFVKQLITRRHVRADVVERIVLAMIELVWDNDIEVTEIAGEVLGVKANKRTELEEFALRGDRELLATGHALALAMGESAVVNGLFYGPQETNRDYLALLGEHGYKLTPAEKAERDGKAPK